MKRAYFSKNKNKHEQPHASSIRPLKIIIVRMKKYIPLTFLIAILLLAIGCEKLDVTNLNSPDKSNLNNTPHDLEIFGKGVFYNYWLNERSSNFQPNINILAEAMADQYTASWGNFGWLVNSGSPRIQWDNVNTTVNEGVLENFYYGSYGVISQANTVIHKILVDKIKLGSGGKNNAKILALCYLIQGLSYGNLGLVFDKNFIVTENTIDVTKVTTSPYKIVRDSAIAALEKTIKICDTASFILEGSIFNNTDINSVSFKQIANSYIARFKVLTSRNISDNLEIDWNSVLENTKNGLTFDFGSRFTGWPYNGGTWYDLNYYYLNLPDWARINCRIINLMDPSYPARYPSNGVAPRVHAGLLPGKAQSSDARLISDFEFLTSVNFKPERGYLFFSHYRYKRFDNLYKRTGDIMFEFRQYENELYKAEAYANLGQLDKATAILNYVSSNYSSPRLSRGLLFTSTTLTKKQLLQTIFYERDIELLGQGFMLAFADMRRRDMLQPGTPLHFPMPGKELQTLQWTIYTTGGTINPGTDSSVGGWFDAITGTPVDTNYP